MSHISKFAQDQKYENSVKKKFLKEYIIFQLEYSYLIHPYINHEKYQLSYIISSIETLGKNKIKIKKSIKLNF